MVMPTSETEARHFPASYAVVTFESGWGTVHCTQVTWWNPCAWKKPRHRLEMNPAKRIRYRAREAEHETTTTWCLTELSPLSWTVSIRLLTQKFDWQMYCIIQIYCFNQWLASRSALSNCFQICRHSLWAPQLVHHWNQWLVDSLYTSLIR